MGNWITNDLGMVPIAIAEQAAHMPILRTPEPEVMTGEEQTRVFMEAAQPTGSLRGTHLLFAELACQSIPEGATVLELGCGPGNVIKLLAEIRPDIKLVGVDLSEQMLALARENTRHLQDRVSFVKGDMTELDQLYGANVVVSCVAIHHLPSPEDLHRCLARIRALGGRDLSMFLFDFVRLHQVKTIDWLVERGRSFTHDALTEDYHNSLHAAFSAEEFLTAWTSAGFDGGMERAWPMPVFGWMRSGPVGAGADAKVLRRLRGQMKGQLWLEAQLLRQMARMASRIPAPMRLVEVKPRRVAA